MSHIAYVGLGSNLPLGTLCSTELIVQAIAQIDQLPCTQLLGKSHFYRSAALGTTSESTSKLGPDYVNAVIKLKTTSEPALLLAQLQSIEQQYQRQRPYPNAPRTLDLDLLIFDTASMTTPALTLPHPRLTERAFVVKPLSELDPNLSLPGLGNISQWLAKTQHQVIERIT
jgi:2-amino-4-hydroxy-6-hydroxymethyldihydropteridine diphosphokinase